MLGLTVRIIVCVIDPKSKQEPVELSLGVMHGLILNS